jgi:Cu/Zn superoxide dismutase
MQTGRDVSITGTLTGLPLSAEIGFHVHRYGNFSTGPGRNMCDSTGPLFDPYGESLTLFRFKV